MCQKHDRPPTNSTHPVVQYSIKCFFPLVPYAISYDMVFPALLICSSKLLWELRQDAAACLGLLCTVLSYEAERIFKWLFLKLTSSSRDEVKLLYLVAAQRALEAAGERKAFSQVMQVTTHRSFCRFLYYSGLGHYWLVPRPGSWIVFLDSVYVCFSS